MSEAQWVVAQLAKVSLLALLIAMAMRGRLGLCWSLTLYVVATLVGNSLATFWPQRFFTPSFWVLKQGVYDGLKIAVADRARVARVLGLSGRLAHRARGDRGPARG